MKAEKSEFVHAGIDESVVDLWEWETGEDTFTNQYPAKIGRIENLDMKEVAGHVNTNETANDPCFFDIYYDGESHYYIDDDVPDSGIIPVLMVDTKADKYYKVTASNEWLVIPYEE